MTKESEEFKKCITCGRYMEAGNAVNGNYCSLDCSIFYSRCSTCGKYFTAGEVRSKDTCSTDCSIVYIMAKSYGEEKYIDYEKESA